MFRLPFRLLTAFPVAVFLFTLQNLSAQKAGLEVTRTSAIDRSLPILNLTVDELGRKWAANSKGVFQLKAADFATPLKIASGEQNVLAYRGGNADFSWPEAAFKEQVKTECNVTATWYDERGATLWIGTDAGLFQFKTEPGFQMVQRYIPANSKLKSNLITLIFQDKSRRLWVGTDKGLMYGLPGKWKGELAGYGIQRVREYAGDIYVMADGEISKGVGGDKWTDLKIDLHKTEGDLNDFDIDQTGKMWLVSGCLTRYDLAAGTYDVFSGPEYYTSQFGTDIAIDPENAVWVGTSDKGVFMVDKASAMTLNAFVDQPITCAGNGKDAILLAKVSGGVAPYTFAWSGGLSGENPRNVGPGTYSLTVTDSKGKTRTADVPVPDARLRIKGIPKKPVSAPGKSDGVAEVDIAINVSGIQILWDNGETTATATKLTAGTHTVTVTDPKGCAATATATIAEKALPLSVRLTEKSGVNCAGDRTGALEVQTTGGKAPLSFTWSDPSLKGEAPAGLKAGNYQVTVADAAGQTITASISLQQPEALSASMLVNAPASTGNTDGKATVQPKGGHAPYTFQWDNGETEAIATKLGPGTRSVTITDSKGCVAKASAGISENILPLAVNITEESKILCAGGKSSLSVQVNGGKSPFQYAWNNASISGNAPSNVPAGDFLVTVTDAAGSTSTATINIRQPEVLSAKASANAPATSGHSDGKATVEVSGGAAPFSYKWDNGETSAAATKLASGTRSVSITDANRCTASASVAIPENILPMSVAIQEGDKIKCAGEKSTLVIQVNGGKTPLVYSWNNPALVGQMPAPVTAGDYQLTVTDAAGTTSTASISIAQPEMLSLSILVTAPASTGNADGKATAQPKGGTTPYSYKWDSGETTLSAIKLAPGARSVTVTDANGCTTTGSVSISENILPLSASLQETKKIKCAGEKSALSVQVNGGKPPYQYSWNNASLSGQEARNLDGGAYSVTVTDAQGNTMVANATVAAPDPLTVELSRNIGTTSDRIADGKAQVSIKGGTPKYSIVWDTKQSGLSATKLALGKHSVTVTDANGCSQNIDFETDKRALPELTGALEDGQTIRMRLLTFSPDSANLKPEVLPMLDELYDFMMENPKVVIEIGGHTNNLADDSFADKLSTARAKAVADYLFAKGVDATRVTYKGYGKRQPIAQNTTPEGRKTNQRVEIKILKIGK